MKWVTMVCFNHTCPFRQNTTSSLNHCECVMCPHRIETTVTYAVSNRTLTADEIARMTNGVVKSSSKTYQYTNPRYTPGTGVRGV